MIHPIFFYLGILFIIGGIATIVVNRNKDYSQRRNNWLKYFVYLIITIVTILTILYEFFYALAIIISILGGIEVIRLVKKDFFKNRRSINILFGYLILIIFFILFSYKLPSQQILFIYIIVAGFDGFSQIFGQLFGKNKLISSISPGKTIEGLIGGVITAAIIAILVKDWVSISILKAFVFGLVISFHAFWGDILASWIKRQYGVKNYGAILPGHGGILDRFDSFLFAGAMCFFILNFYN